jgi:pimeloyl-ACP methyl ester carboxylesterase
MPPDVRFCTSVDGSRIAFGVSGEGPGLLFCPQLCEQFSQLHTVVRWQEYIDELSRGFRRVQYDHRGTGLSERDVSDFSLDSRLLDLEAVVDAANLERFGLYGSLLGGPLVIAYAVRHPERVSHLVLYGTYARGVDVMSWEQLSGIVELARGNWTLAAQLLADFSTREQHPEAGVQLAEHFRGSTTGEELAEGLSQGYRETDVTRLLGEVRAPTLILHRREDTVVPFVLGQQLAAGIPSARFVPLEAQFMPSSSVTALL